MVEGIYFYWFTWMGWVIFTFLEKKNKRRQIICLLLLLQIIFVNKTVRIWEYDVSISYIILLLLSFVYISIQKNKTILYMLMTSMIITLAYVSFLLFEMFDPVWIIFDRKWMLATCMVYITLLLQNKPMYRIICASLGMIQGQLLFTLILSRYNFMIDLGDMIFFDSLAISVLLLFCWNVLEHFSKVLESIVYKGRNKNTGKQLLP